MKKIILFFILPFYLPAIDAQQQFVFTSESESLYVKIAGSGPACLYLHGSQGFGSYWLEKFMKQSLEKKS